MKFWTGAVLAAVVLAACDGEPTTPGGGGGGGGGTGGGTGIALSVDVMQNISNAATQDVVLNWIPGPDDGYGALDGFRATATDSLAQTDTSYVPEPGRTTTFTFGPWAINTVVSGAACVRAERRSLSSAYVCTGWSASVDDQAPPTPIVDSVRATSNHDSLTVVAYYRLAPSDGGGAYTMAVYAKDNSGVDSASVAVATAPGSQAVSLPGPYTYQQSYTGQACVTATRRALFSQACASFTALVVDVPPPPPILPVSLHIYPESLPDMATMFPTCENATVQVDSTGYTSVACTTHDSAGRTVYAVKQLCAMFEQSDSNFYMLSGQDDLQVCRDHYDALPYGKLPGYPVAMARPWFDGTKMVLRRDTAKEELASVIFAGAYSKHWSPWAAS